MKNTYNVPLLAVYHHERCTTIPPFRHHRNGHPDARLPQHQKHHHHPIHRHIHLPERDRQHHPTPDVHPPEDHHHHISSDANTHVTPNIIARYPRTVPGYHHPADKPRRRHHHNRREGNPDSRPGIRHNPDINPRHNHHTKHPVP